MIRQWLARIARKMRNYHMDRAEWWETARVWLTFREPWQRIAQYTRRPADGGKR